jgi:Ca2+-binding RTX toxin-like protein
MAAPRQVLVAALVPTVLALALATTAWSASSTVPGSKASRIVQSIGVNDLKPAACAGITLSTLVVGVNGTSSDDLLLGTAGIDIMNGGAGNDCILGGGGADTIAGGTGTDVCIGGPGTDTFSSCETSIQ